MFLAVTHTILCTIILSLNRKVAQYHMLVPHVLYATPTRVLFGNILWGNISETRNMVQ